MPVELQTFSGSWHTINPYHLSSQSALVCTQQQSPGIPRSMVYGPAASESHGEPVKMQKLSTTVLTRPPPPARPTEQDSAF